MTLTQEQDIIRENELLKQQLKKCNEEKDILADALEKSFEEISLLHKIGDIICLDQRPSVYIEKIICDLKDVANCDHIVIFWHNISTENNNNNRPAIFQEGKYRLANNTINTMWQIASIVIEGDQLYTIENEFQSHNLPDRIDNFLVTGIKGKEGPIGAIAAINKDGGFSTLEARMTMSISNRLSSCHENQTLYLKQQELMMGTLRALVRSIDAKDPYTCGHSERVADISRFIAENMDLPSEDIEDAYLTGLLHDIGKIGVSGSTLRKAERLNEQEFDEIKKHPQIGAEILKDIKQMSVVVNGVLTHHERYDGKGYPFGLSGTNIPLIGRIVNIADTFDAMISTRPYRKSLPLSKVLYEISRFSGTQFDPEIAEVLLKNDIADLIKRLEDTDIRVDKERYLSSGYKSDYQLQGSRTGIEQRIHNIKETLAQLT